MKNCDAMYEELGIITFENINKYRIGSFMFRTSQCHVPDFLWETAMSTSVKQCWLVTSIIHRSNLTWAWWRHQMETFSALLALCAEHSPVTVEFPSQRPATRSYDVFFDLRLNKRLNKQSWGWWFETPSCSLWRHSNGKTGIKCKGVIIWNNILEEEVNLGVSETVFERTLIEMLNHI